MRTVTSWVVPLLLIVMSLTDSALCPHKPEIRITFLPITLHRRYLALDNKSPLKHARMMKKSRDHYSGDCEQDTGYRTANFHDFVGLFTKIKTVTFYAM
jgi:hypothetical protein